MISHKQLFLLGTDSSLAILGHSTLEKENYSLSLWISNIATKIEVYIY